MVAALRLAAAVGICGRAEGGQSCAYLAGFSCAEAGEKGERFRPAGTGFLVMALLAADRGVYVKGAGQPVGITDPAGQGHRFMAEADRLIGAA